MLWLWLNEQDNCCHRCHLVLNLRKQERDDKREKKKRKKRKKKKEEEEKYSAAGCFR